MRPFSIDGSGKAINLFNISSKQLIRAASIKGQCAHDNFYGEVVEHALRPLEGKYASVVKTIDNGSPVLQKELSFLLNFTFLQYMRTDYAARHHVLASEDLAILIAERQADLKKQMIIDQKFAVQESMAMFSEAVHLITDLKICIIRNLSKIPFFTPDDPAVQANRFRIQRQRLFHGGVGLTNAGLMFFLPLTPKYQLVAYDGDVYTCPDRQSNFVDISSALDASSLNKLQVVKANQNLYFSNWQSRTIVSRTFEEAAARRPEAWHKLHYAVRDRENERSDHKRYRVVHTEEERLAAREALVHLESVSIDPGVWCSKIKFRAKPIYFDTQTGAGLVRRVHATKQH